MGMGDKHLIDVCGEKEIDVKHGFSLKENSSSFTSSTGLTPSLLSLPLPMLTATKEWNKYFIAVLNLKIFYSKQIKVIALYCPL